MEYLIKIEGELKKLRFDLMIFGSNTMLNYQLSQKLKLIGRGEFNHLIISLTVHIPYTMSWRFGSFRGNNDP